MYEPCWECKLRRGFGYSQEECDDKCGYAGEVKSLKDRIQKLNGDLEKAYEVIGQLADKPNPFYDGGPTFAVLVPGLDRIFLDSSDGDRIASLAKRTNKTESEVIKEALKHYDDLVRIADLMNAIPNP
jgi:hypothetical protein